MGIAVLLVLFLLLVLVILPLWVFMRIRSFERESQVREVRFNALEEELRTLRRRLAEFTPAGPPPQSAPAPLAPTPPSPITPPATAPVAPPIVPPAPAAYARPLPAATPPAPAVVAPRPTPPPLPPVVTTSTLTPRPPARPRINLEQFVGAKLFAWLGGLTAFLAVAFFVKYSFEHDLIPPEVRVSIGFLCGAALVVSGLWIRAERYRVIAHVLCATGVVSLYAVTFACNAVYHFAFFSPTATFLLMVLITSAAFLLAIRLNAHVVALLGLLGGFLTPVLVSTGQDNPLGLFGYIALLDLGLVAVALHRRWHYLFPLAGAGTVLLQIGWTEKFFAAPRAALLVTISLGFAALFSVAAELGRRWRQPSLLTTGTAAGLSLSALGFAGFFLTFASIGERAGLLFGFIFAADLLLLALAWRDELASRIHLLAGAIVFTLLGAWTAARLTDPLLPWALGAYLVFAILHTAFPLVLERRRPGTSPGWVSQLFPPVTLLLMMAPLLKLDTVPLLFWPAVLVLDAIAVALALLSGSLVALGAVLVLTLATAGLSIWQLPAAAGNGDALLWVIGAFAVFFFAAGLFLARRLPAPAGARGSTGPLDRLFGEPRAQLPAFAALLPFVLLVMMSQRLALPQPAALFGLALLLSVLVLGLARLLTLAWLPGCALAGVAALEYAWHAKHFSVAHAPQVLPWYLGFYALFAAFPFFFRRRFSGLTGPWAIAALSGVVQAPLVYRLISLAWPNDFMGALPAAFALAPLASLVAILRSPATDPARRLDQLAWFGGVALLFITLIFPVQFERQWITLAWALEGVALLWLFHRVPHPGLRATGVALLTIAFARLALNQAVLSYHPRSDTPILNWYLYAYGITIVCLFAGARLFRSRTSAGNHADQPETIFGLNAPALLNTFGAILAFLLLNIEIADFFSAPGSTLTFQFSGNFARDLAYTIGWALFALGLLGAGIWRRTRPARIAAIALLGVTLLKLFFHDLAHLGQLYRVGALVGVAVVAILASFLYQRFAPTDDARPPESP